MNKLLSAGKKAVLIKALPFALLTTLTIESQAFTQETHKRIVIDAVSYMKANPETTEFKRLKAAANAAGYTVEQMAEVMGQAAYDVDDFEDTFLCGSVTGDCVRAPVWGIGSAFVNYSSFWHFQNQSRGSDVHGNDFGGYNYDQLTVGDSSDGITRAWLGGDHLDDGPGGMDGWWGMEDSEYNTYGVTEANYRQGSYSRKSMYEDYEDMPFQPVDNLGQYWYNQFWQQPSAQTLGFALHTTDLLVPMHTWTTLGRNHSGWEGWVRDYYDDEGLNDFDLVSQALQTFTPPVPGNPEIRETLTQGGTLSYSTGAVVLSSTEHEDRKQVARNLVPHAIAMAVHVLNHAALRF